MTVFADYSRYYNLLYADKDYAGEVGFIEGLIREYKPGAKSILDLGCGTGRHASFLADRNYRVHGVDMSEEMLLVASQVKRPDGLTFSRGDVRSIRLGRKFDAVISLFHVMCYQTTNEDLKKAFLTAYEHLDKDGIFIFDCWYGPAVLTIKPSVRIKRLEDNKTLVTRISEPIMHPNENIVDVDYQVFIREKSNNKTTILQEKHKMRYLFKPEIEEMLTAVGFKLLSCEEWMSRKEPGFDSWSVYFVVKK